MKKIISLFLAMLLICTILAGCGGKTTPPSESKAAGQSAKVSAGQNSSGGTTVSNSFSAYMTAKSAMISKLSDGLSKNDKTAFIPLTLAGVAMIDLALIPVSLFGLQKEAVVSGLSMFKAEGVEYSANGNSYTISYKDEKGVVYKYSGTYDAAKDALTSTVSEDGKESIYVEYRKTSYGYAGQYYTTNEDGTTSLYQITVNGEDGVIGLSTSAKKPAALTGSEAVDFPSACSEWYAVKGKTITGVTSDGTKLNFEFAPTPSAS